VLGLCEFQHRTVLCYIHTSPDSIYTNAGFVQDPTQIILCYAHNIMQSFLIAISFSVLASPMQHVSAKLLELHHGYAEETVH